MEDRTVKSPLALVVAFFQLIFLSQCQKKLEPVIFYNMGEFQRHGNKFSTSEGMVTISFPNSFGRCLVKLYPRSSVKVLESYRRMSKPEIRLSEHSGTILIHAENCNFEIDEKVRCENCVLFLKDSVTRRLEVIDGKAVYGGLVLKKNQGYIPSQDRIYVLRSKVNTVFPRNGQEVIIPFFLWEKKEDVELYFLEFASDRDFFNTVFYVVVRENRFFPERLRIKAVSRRLYWRVLYEDKDGIGGVPSDPQEFVIP